MSISQDTFYNCLLTTNRQKKNHCSGHKFKSVSGKWYPTCHFGPFILREAVVAQDISCKRVGTPRKQKPSLWMLLEILDLDFT
jgi:hypothetical protein